MQPFEKVASFNKKAVSNFFKTALVNFIS